MALYRSQKIRLCCCKEKCTIKFPKGNYKFAAKFEQWVRTVALVAFALEWVFTWVDLLITTTTAEEKHEEVPSEFDNFGLDIVQVILTFIVMYCLYIYNSFVSKIVKRDDPFQNSNIFIFIIFMVILQKYGIEVLFVPFFGGIDGIMNLGVVVRQTIMAIELLFVIIPIRHNFSLNYVES